MKVVTAWNVENAKPGDDAPEVPMTWPRQCLACVQHAVSMDTVDEAEAMVIADWTPWVGQWVPMCASGIANYRHNKRPVAVPAAFNREVLPLHRTEAGWPRCSTCDGGGCPDCTDPAS